MLPPKTARTLEAILARTVRVDEPGIAVGVLKHDPKHGSMLWRGARGLSNLESKVPLTTRTPFRICSISKQFACALVMREVAAGRIALDAHPSRYLPCTRDMDRALTLAHLMQNKSGLRDQWVLAMMMGATATQPFTLDDGVNVNRRAPESMFAPGSQNLYCNANFEILGQVLEKVSGETYAQLLSQHILLPLGMRDSALAIDTAQPLPGDARGYRFRSGAWEEEQNALHWAASAGIVSTVEDMLKWAACLRDPQAAGMPWVAAITRASPFNDGAAASYASGINHMVNPETGRAVLAHAGALRGWRSLLMHFVQEEISIVVFMNRTNGPKPRPLRGLVLQFAKALGVAPVWRGAGKRPKRAMLPAAAEGAYVSREQGLLIQLRNHRGRAEVHSHLDWSPLFHAGEAGTFTTDDGHLTIHVNERVNEAAKGSLSLSSWLTLNAENVHAKMQRVLAPRVPDARFAARGRYHCAPLASTLEIVAGKGGEEIGFTGVFGTGTRYPLTRLNTHTAWFDISRGVDESPPGRVLVIFDATAGLLELNCMLARRMVFRSA
jgi:D-aminopeptidase